MSARRSGSGAFGPARWPRPGIADRGRPVRPPPPGNRLPRGRAGPGGSRHGGRRTGGAGPGAGAAAALPGRLWALPPPRSATRAGAGDVVLSRERSPVLRMRLGLRRDTEKRIGGGRKGRRTRSALGLHRDQWTALERSIQNKINYSFNCPLQIL